MASDYIIHKGAKIRLLPEGGLDSALEKLVTSLFERHDCLKSYCIFSMQQGWIFRKKSRFLCLVYADAKGYLLASNELKESLVSHFNSHPGSLDVMSLDVADKGQLRFATILMAKLPFKKKVT